MRDLVLLIAFASIGFGRVAAQDPPSSEQQLNQDTRDLLNSAFDADKGPNDGGLGSHPAAVVIRRTLERARIQANEELSEVAPVPSDRPRPTGIWERLRQRLLTTWKSDAETAWDAEGPPVPYPGSEGNEAGNDTLPGACPPGPGACSAR